MKIYLYLLVLIMVSCGVNRNVEVQQNENSLQQKLQITPAFNSNHKVRMVLEDEKSYRIVQKKDMSTKVVIKVPKQPEPKRVVTSSVAYVGAGVASILILYSLPEESTNWKKKDLNLQSLGQNWSTNVSNGLVIDQDNWVFNYVMHPYFGSVYYNTLRGAGYSWWGSALYTAGMSSLYWEYGFEAIAEKPSIQDMIITPLGGVAIGELVYRAKKRIKRNNDFVLNSGFLGRACLLLTDPMNEVQDWFKAKKIRRKYEMDSRWSSWWQPMRGGMGLAVRWEF